MKRLCRKSGLKYLTCEDWLIYACDESGNVYQLITELWNDWERIAKEKNISEEELIQEPNSTEKYMLPIAKEGWDSQNWQDTGYTVWELWSENELDYMFKKSNINLPIKK